MTAGNWLLGWVLCGMMLGVGIWHGWWGLAGLGVVFGIVWWYIPDIFGTHQDPPEDTR